MSETRVVHVRDNVPGAVYIGRAMPGRTGSPLGNPFKIGRDGDRGQVLDHYKHWLAKNLPVYQTLRDSLIACRGKPLACFCLHDGAVRPSKNHCHGDVLITFLDRYSDDEIRAMGCEEV